MGSGVPPGGFPPIRAPHSAPEAGATTGATSGSTARGMPPKADVSSQADAIVHDTRPAFRRSEESGDLSKLLRPPSEGGVSAARSPKRKQGGVRVKASAAPTEPPKADAATPGTHLPAINKK